MGKIVTGSDDKLGYLWRMEDRGEGRVVLKGHEKSVTAVACGGSLVASGGRDGAVKVWTADGECQQSWQGHTLTVAAVDVTACSSRIASGSRDGFVRVWDVGAGSEVASGHAPRNLVTCGEWLPTAGSTANAQVFVQGAEDLSVRVWDCRVGLDTPALTLSGYTYFPLDLACAADGVRVLTSSKGFNSVGAEARVWDLRSPGTAQQSAAAGAGEGSAWGGTESLQVSGHEQDATACGWVPVGACEALGRSGQDLFVTGSKDGSVRLWGGEGQLHALHTPGAGGWMALAPGEAGPHFVAGHFQGQVVTLDVVQGEEGGLCLAQQQATAAAPDE